MTEEKRLSHEDIQILMKDPSADNKIGIVNKLSAQYNSKGFSEEQISLAEQIFRLLLRQAEVEVRKALSENLTHSKLVPHDIVLSLAKDVEEVAMPVLEFSQVLTEKDLVGIIKSTEKTALQLAITRRENISEEVSSALIDAGNEEVVNSLINNEGTKISEEGYNRVVNKFSSSEKIVDAMVTRGSVPQSVIEHLTNKITEELQKKIEHKYEKKFQEINVFFKETGEIASLKFLGRQKIDKELLDLVDDLEKSDELDVYLDPVNGKLTNLLNGLEETGSLTPVSALVMGHLTLFEISLARIVNVPFSNIKKLIDDSKGFKALYDKAKMPPKFFDAIEFVLIVIRTMEEQAKKENAPRACDNLFLFSKNISVESHGKNIANLAHIISMIQQNAESVMGEW